MNHASWSWLYCMIAGVALGLLLSESGMGRVSPASHAAFFGASAEYRAVVDYRKESLDQFRALQATGVTETAITEHIAQRYEGEQVLMARQESAMWPRVSVYMSALVGMMLLALTLRWFSVLPKPTTAVLLSVCSGLCLVVMFARLH